MRRRLGYIRVRAVPIEDFVSTLGAPAGVAFNYGLQTAETIIESSFHVSAV
jgi:hypothetical protein